MTDAVGVSVLLAFTSYYPLSLKLDSRSKDLWNDGGEGLLVSAFLVFALLRELCALCGLKLLLFLLVFSAFI